MAHGIASHHLSLSFLSQSSRALRPATLPAAGPATLCSSPLLMALRAAAPVSALRRTALRRTALRLCLDVVDEHRVVGLRAPLAVGSGVHGARLALAALEDEGEGRQAEGDAGGDVVEVDGAVLAGREEGGWGFSSGWSGGITRMHEGMGARGWYPASVRVCVLWVGVDDGGLVGAELGQVELNLGHETACNAQLKPRPDKENLRLQSCEGSENQ